LPAIPLVLNFSANDSSQRFLGYDHPVNIYKTLSAGDTLLCAADTPAFNILYLKQAMGYFDGIKLYDLNANLFDIKPYEEKRDSLTEKNLIETNADIASGASGRVFCAEFTAYPQRNLYPSQTGIIYRLSGDRMAAPGTSRIMDLYTLRDFYNTKRADIFYREIISRYFLAEANYCALKNDATGFENLRSVAEKTSPDNPGIISSIASSYFFYMHDAGRAEKYLEHSVDIDPYYYASMRLLVKLYTMDGRKDMAAKWFQIYSERENNRKKIEEFRESPGIYNLQK